MPNARQRKIIDCLNPSILREYDIRGVVGDTLRVEDAYAIGRAFGTCVRRTRQTHPKVAVAYDGRLSSPDLEQQLVAGLCDAGVDVLRVGLGPSPMLYYSVFEKNVDGGIIITGSHNPSDYNGFKMVMDKFPLFGDKVQEIGRLIVAQDFESGQGNIENLDVRDDYLARLIKDYHGKKPLRVAWDAGNGAAGELMARLTEKLPGTHILLNEKIDGTFPAHHPDPTVEKNLVQLQQAVAENHCDLGVGFDGDGDRIGVIDGTGRVVWGDQLLAILSRDVLARNPGAAIVADIKASQILVDEVSRLGGKAVLWKCGHSLVKSKMKELHSPLGGEMSGHIFFADGYYGFDDALYVAVRLLSLLAQSDQTLVDMMNDLPHLPNTPEYRFYCDDDKKFQVVEKIKKDLKVDYLDVDGVRVQTKDGWWLLRASNTQPALSARCEGVNDPALQKMRDHLRVCLEQAGVTPPEEL